MLIKHGSTEEILHAVEEVIKQVNLAEAEKENFYQRTRDALTGFEGKNGSNFECRYLIRKRNNQIELKLFVYGEPYNPLEEDSENTQVLMEAILNKFTVNRSITSIYQYVVKQNIVVIRSPQFRIIRGLWKDPMIIAMASGILLGLICARFPSNIKGFIVDEITSPLFSIYTDIVNGIMGPTLFLTLITAIAAMDSIKQLSTLGFRLVLRYVKIIIFIIAMAVGIGIIFFHDLTMGDVSFDPHSIMEMLYSVIPTNLVTPFVENSYSQLMIIAFGIGAALLILGESAKKLTGIIDELRQCIIIIWKFVQKIIPVVPFLSLFNMVVTDQTDIIISAWRYMLAIIICYIIAVTYKTGKVSLKLKINPLIIIKKMKPVLARSFATASFSTTLDMRKEISVKEMGIESGFSNFWISTSFSMLDINTPIYLVASVFWIAQITATPISLSFFIVLAFMAFQLSLAGAGITSACTISFKTLGIGLENVGIISVCRVFMKNITTTLSLLYSDMEQIEAAYRNKAIDLNVLKK